MSSKRDWCFTYNNPEVTMEFFGERLLDWKCKYYIFGREVAPTTSTPHYQGYVYWEQAKSFEQVTKKFPGIHWSKAIKGPETNKRYCSKEGEYLEHGSPPRQGTRNDLERAKEMVAEGCSLTDILREVSSLGAVNYAEKMLKYMEQKRTWKTRVVWYWGKESSNAAYEFMGQEEHWKACKSLKWWEGYDAHEYVLIDGFTKSWCEITELEQILGNKEYRVECKGGSRQLLARWIIITSREHPKRILKDYRRVKPLLDGTLECRGTETEVAGNNRQQLPE